MSPPGIGADAANTRPGSPVLDGRQVRRILDSPAPVLPLPVPE